MALTAPALSGKWFYGDLVFIVDPFFGDSGVPHFCSPRSRWQLLLVAGGVILTSLLVYAGAIRRVLDYPAMVITLWVAVFIGLVICRKGDIRSIGAKSGIRRLAFVVSTGAD
jgi:hypothetical protein